MLKWCQNDITKQFAKKDYFEIAKNEKEALIVDLTFAYCLAQIVVSKPMFAPYQYVSFEAMTLDTKKAQETGEPELVYFFYDSIETSEKEVLDELDYGVHFCSKYIPEKFKKLYLNKRGFLIIKNENLHRVIHPDDLKQFHKDMTVNDFVCIDTDCQYLVIVNDSFSLRVLPTVFIIEEEPFSDHKIE